MAEVARKRGYDWAQTLLKSILTLPRMGAIGIEQQIELATGLITDHLAAIYSSERSRRNHATMKRREERRAQIKEARIRKRELQQKKIRHWQQRELSPAELNELEQKLEDAMLLFDEGLGLQAISHNLQIPQTKILARLRETNRKLSSGSATRRRAFGTTSEKRSAKKGFRKLLLKF